MTPKYPVGTEVQSVTDPSRIGAVVEICEVHAGVQWYRVSFGQGNRPRMPEPDLRLYLPGESPIENLIKGQIDGYREFQRLLTYQRLWRQHPLRNNIYAFNASRTRFYPYQFKPLLKFLDSPKNRLLIADEVGLGKTIEACLIMTELRARQTLDRILVVCPANLRDKWQMELKRRFGEDFENFSGAGDFRRFLERYQEAPDSTRLQGIVSLESIRTRSILEKLEDIQPSLNLVIVDEAHHMRNFGTLSREAGVKLGTVADALIFLTATPIHLGNENLYSLFNILDSEDFPDFYTSDLRFEQNEPIVRAQVCMAQLPPNVYGAVEQLQRSKHSEWIRNNPLVEEIEGKLAALAGKERDATLRPLIVEAQRDLAELNLISHIFTRTKKREAQTNLAQRRAYALKVQLTPLERAFYLAVTNFVRAESARRIDSPLVIAWVVNMPQRRVASSLPAMVDFYRKNLAFSESDVPEDLEPGELEGFDQTNEYESARLLLRQLIDGWPEEQVDSKYSVLIDTLRGLRRQEGRVKTVIFSFFLDTLRYLARRLQRDGFTCVMIHGGIKAAERPDVIRRFRDEPSVEILLSSRVGSEGLDFQFCDTLFNYDLPWNPMEVEQRIGRLDRIGQESPVIRIYNFWVEDTIEQRILQRLYDRIGVFERSIGELEMILGDVISELEREILSKQLSAEEEERILDQKLSIIERQKRDLAQLEQESAKFVGTDHFFDLEVEAIKSQRRFVTGEQVHRFLEDFIRTECPRTGLVYDRNLQQGVIHPDSEFKSRLHGSTEPGSLGRFLSAGDQGVPITFDSQEAFDHPNLEFINILHPVTQGIVQHYSQGSKIDSNAHHVILSTDRLQTGFYFYFVFRLKVSAARGQNTLEMVILNDLLQPACQDDEAEAVLGEMLEKGEDPSGMSLRLEVDSPAVAGERATQFFHDRVEEIRERVEKNNDKFIDRRVQSIRAHYKKLLDGQRGRLWRAEIEEKDERYRRLLRGNIRRLEFELSQKQQFWESKRKVQVEYDEISAGILEVP